LTFFHVTGGAVENPGIWQAFLIAWQICGACSVVNLVVALVLGCAPFVKAVKASVTRCEANLDRLPFEILLHVLSLSVILVLLLVVYVLGPIGLVFFVSMYVDRGMKTTTIIWDSKKNRWKKK
jgi:type III secretory pathway component EscU